MEVEFFVNDFGNGGEAICGAGGVGKEVVGLGVIGVFVDAHDDGAIEVFAGGGNDDFFSAGFEVFAGAFVIGKDASGFDYDIDFEVFPREVGWVSFLNKFNIFSVNGEGVFVFDVYFGV